jgi:predicted nucleic acid-binding protein
VISRTPEAGASQVIFDNTVLSNFSQVQACYVLRRLYEGRAFICRTIQQAIQAIHQAFEDDWLHILDNEVSPDEKIVELQLDIEYRQRFGGGTAEAIAIARTRNWVFASDDASAKRFATERGIRVTSSLGILVKAVSSEILSLSAADAIHAQMIDEGYRSPLPYQNGISSVSRQKSLPM